ncbi:AraC family transcriptional regulator [Paenibacillus radicis (ex Xue et al. 2023)]|uniref:AraC family transcriptional regulator n=1 Tax=Paenibacillus radicis (ex Xue et al. 2023) TaxID=2972489 RepID=A0ABT1YHD0_9BACL|nr:AraC family transcriptional regulator [Paenibacillus radicis (ex Xue et al. 2023)]MCR8631633.1 AraC family transcriptional regulator [Paenibacillus radicis (ex Xue et al. 2023)]
MKMSWYYRMLLSYTPIFFVVISVLIFSFFAVLNDSAQKQIVNTKKVIATKVLQVIDANLKTAERMVIKEIYTNAALKEYFGESGDKVLYDYFRISQKMDELSSGLPFSNSIYLYNANTSKILSRSGLSPLDEFGDRNFLLDAYTSNSNAIVWTNPRPFKEFSHESSDERVVTMVKFYPDAGKKQGAVVVNIRVQALVGFVKDLTRLDGGPISLLASNMDPFDRNSIQPSHPADKSELSSLYIKSDYTGWKYGSGGPTDKRLSLASLFNDFWMLVGISTITAGLIWFTYITHRNYKPIQAIAGRINNYTKRKSGKLVKTAVFRDELKYIEAAIDELLERASQFEQLHRDDLLIRRKQLLLDWLEGHKVMNAAQWKNEMAELQMPSDCQTLTVAVMEIDRFTHFTGIYNSRDQYLLKFVLSNVLQEMAQNDNMVVWNEWFEPQQMAVVFYLNTNPFTNQAVVTGAMKKLQDWILNNLDFTVSVGIGSEVYSPMDVAQSYSEAKEYVSYKPVFGVGSIIGSGELHSKAEGRIFPHLQLVRTIAKSFRLSDGQWQFHYTQLFQSLKKGRISQSDIGTITNYLMYHLHNQMSEMAEEVSKLWHNEYAAKFEAISNSSETLEEWRERLNALLVQLEVEIRSLRSAKNNYALIRRVKEYIEIHYTDPNLSLNQISERFEMNPRYLSKLFKEEFGEKFMEYMLKIRLEEAQRLLLTTQLPVQDIAERVGYVHVISFHRAFKNMYGIPPGDYRKRAEGS